MSEGTASWSDLNDGAGGLFHKVDDGVDDLVEQTSGPIIEIGPGSGALTHPMAL